MKDCPEIEQLVLRLVESDVVDYYRQKTVSFEEEITTFRLYSERSTVTDKLLN